jgi:hypothetical protein
MLSEQTLRYAEEITATILGVDALCRAELRAADPDAAAGRAIEAGRKSLVVLNMARDQRPEPFGSYADARQRLGELASEAAALPEADRRLYYDQLCRATRAFTLWREGQLPFREQIADFLTIPPEPVPVAQIDALHADLRRELSDLGFGGDLAGQCAAWEERHRIPREAVIETLKEYLDRAWERTAAVFDLPAPRSDGMRPVPESGVPYNARCDYLRREVHLNIDPILTGPALEHLAIHECYPGHWTQFKLREVWYDRGEAPADGLLSLVNSASSCVFEGIADCGFRFVNWPDSPDTRIAATLTRQRAAIGAGAARRLHALGWSVESVRDWLREQALVGGEGWIANRMAFIGAPQRATLIWSYWWGEAAVAPVWARIAPQDRPAFLHFLYGRMHSPASVALFS